MRLLQEPANFLEVGLVDLEVDLNLQSDWYRFAFELSGLETVFADCFDCLLIKHKRSIAVLLFGTLLGCRPDYMNIVSMTIKPYYQLYEGISVHLASTFLI